MRRAVERHIEDTLAEAILNEEITSSDCKVLIAKLKDKEIYFEPMNETPIPVLTENHQIPKINNNCIYLLFNYETW